MRGKLLSMSATVMMLGTMLMTGQADVQYQSDYQEEIQQQYEVKTEAAVIPVMPEPPETGVIERTHDVHNYTQDDATLIKRIALAEGEIEGADGMWMIMSVIINRVNNPDFPDTVTGVVYQTNAFSCLKDGNFDKAPGTSEDAEMAWLRIESGDICPQIIAFEGLDSDVLDQWFWEAFTYKHHKFYTKRPKK